MVDHVNEKLQQLNCSCFWNQSLHRRAHIIELQAFISWQRAERLSQGNLPLSAVLSKGQGRVVGIVKKVNGRDTLGEDVDDRNSNQLVIQVVTLVEGTKTRIALRPVLLLCSLFNDDNGQKENLGTKQ